MRPLNPLTPLNPAKNAIESIAAIARQSCASTAFGLIFVAGLMAGCSAIDKPTRPSMYDFGPGLPTQSAAAATPAAHTLPPMAIADISTAGGAIENQAVLYRLAYTDAQELRPYSQARWSMPPAQLVNKRMRELLGQRRVVLTAREGIALNRSQNANLPMLRVELEEFSHLFSAPDASVGLIRLHATLVDITPQGEKLVAQRSFALQRPAASANAAGGVRALSEATDAAIEAIDQWMQQLPAR